MNVIKPTSGIDSLKKVVSPETPAQLISNSLKHVKEKSKDTIFNKVQQTADAMGMNNVADKANTIEETKNKVEKFGGTVKESLKYMDAIKKAGPIGAVSLALNELKKDVSDVGKGGDKIKKIDGIFGVFSNFGDKIGKVFSGLKDWAWIKMPGLAKFFGLKKSKTLQTAEDYLSGANKKVEKFTKGTQKVADNISENEGAIKNTLYGQAMPLFVKMFYPIRDSKKEKNDCIKILQKTVIKKSKFTDFIDMIFDEKPLPENVEINESTKKALQRLFTESYKTPDGKKVTPKGLSILKKFHKDKLRTMTVRDLFSTSGMLVFSGLKKLKSKGIGDMGGALIKSLSENPFEKLTPGYEGIKNSELYTKLSSINFGEQFSSKTEKAKLVAKLLNFSVKLSDEDFVTTTMDSIDSTTSYEADKKFVTKLHSFGEKIIDNMEKTGKFGEMNEINKTGIGMKTLLHLYIVTGGNSNIQELNPMQKSQIYAVSLISRPPEAIGAAVADLIDSGGKIVEGGYDKLKETIPDDVIDIMSGMGRIAIETTQKGAIATLEAFLGFARKSPLIALCMILALLFLPMFNAKNRNLLQIFRG